MGLLAEESFGALLRQFLAVKKVVPCVWVTDVEYREIENGGVADSLEMGSVQRPRFEWCRTASGLATYGAFFCVRIVRSVRRRAFSPCAPRRPNSFLTARADLSVLGLS
jgi:hypothetical protein